VRERLYKSRDDRMLFGVAGGMAEWMDLDPAIVRLVWALLILAGGVGLLLYIIAAIVIPDAPFGAVGMATASGTGTPDETRQARRAARRQGNGSAGVVFGALLVIAGVWFLVNRYLPAFDTSWLIPGVLIVVGIALLVGAMGRSRNPG